MPVIALRSQLALLPLRAASVASLLVVGAASAQTSLPTAPALATRTLAASCAACHGTDGRAVPGSAIPGLAGQPASYLVAQMQAFVAGQRPATVMQQIAKGYTPAQIEALAAYFATRKRE